MPKNNPKNPQNHQIRVVSGLFRGARLQSPPSGTHPMGAREKLALFNMVDVADLRVLDLYAGSGAIGIEALSRGAKEAVFVDNSRAAADIIEHNLQGITSRLDNASAFLAQTYSETTQKFLTRPQFLHYFQVIFADPPYDDFQISQLEGVSALLTADGVFALSSPANSPEPELAGLALVSSRTYAGARITLYRPS